MSEVRIIYLLCKSIDWVLDDRDLRHERVKKRHLNKKIRKQKRNRKYWKILELKSKLDESRENSFDTQEKASKLDIVFVETDYAGH